MENELVLLTCEKCGFVDVPGNRLFCPYCDTRLNTTSNDEDEYMGNNCIGYGNYGYGNSFLYGSKAATAVEETHWESAVSVIESCGHEQVKSDGVVYISDLAKAKIQALMGKYKSIEWLAYLVGDGEDKYFVKDIVIPEQKVTSVTVRDIEFANEEGLPIIGVIHSHHSMGSKFSHTDEEYLNQNHDISLCVSHSGIEGKIRVQTPCGCYLVRPASVRIKSSFVFEDKENFLSSAEEKIKTHTVANRYTYTSFPGSYGNGYGGNYSGTRQFGRFGCWEYKEDEEEEKFESAVNDRLIREKKREIEKTEKPRAGKNERIERAKSVGARVINAFKRLDLDKE
jgi:hypothetical protein